MPAKVGNLSPCEYSVCTFRRKGKILSFYYNVPIIRSYDSSSHAGGCFVPDLKIQYIHIVENLTLKIGGARSSMPSSCYSH